MRAVRWSHAAPLVHGEAVRPVHLLGGHLHALDQCKGARMAGAHARNEWPKRVPAPLGAQPWLHCDGAANAARTRHSSSPANLHWSRSGQAGIPRAPCPLPRHGAPGWRCAVGQGAPVAAGRCPASSPRVRQRRSDREPGKAGRGRRRRAASVCWEPGSIGGGCLPRSADGRYRGAWPPAPGARPGGSCLRERRCSSEVATALPKMPIAVNTATAARINGRKAQDS